MPSATTHEAKVAAIVAQVRALVSSGSPAHIAKGGVRHFVPLPGDSRFRGRAIDTSALREILAIDPLERTCVAEPGVTFGELVRETLRHGLLPTVVPELEGITVGGAVAGCSVESMSYRTGGFHDSCLEYEAITGTGDVLVCSPRSEPLVFGMLHGSYGTLGILTRVTFRLVPAQPFVRVEYRRYETAEGFEAAVRERIAADDFEFIDGIVHGPDRFVLCLGRFVPDAPYTSDYRRDSVYYRSTVERTEDFLATPDYCFRYDAECHWLSRTVPPLEWKPVRRLLGRWFLGSTNLIRWSKLLEPALAWKKRPDVVCDYFVPSRAWSAFFAWYAQRIDYFPLWLVPYRIAEPYPWLDPAWTRETDDDLFFDCAVYGKPNDDPDIDVSQLLEQKVFELRGIKTLISRNHYSREDFWRVYNRSNYDAVKSRLDPHGLFQGLYEKFHR
jgi:FAD/FMN-containing dehydrogenase